MKLRGYQKTAVTKLFNKYKNNIPMILSYFPRTGKTVIFLMLLKEIQNHLNRKINVLVVSGLESTKASVKNDIENFSEFDNISYNGEKSKAFSNTKDINVDNILFQSLSGNKKDSDGNYIINNEFEGKIYDVIIVDEAHTFTTTKRTKDIFNQISDENTSFIHITGTPESFLIREGYSKEDCVDLEENDIFYIKYHFDECVENGLYNDIEVYEEDRSFYESFKSYTYNYINIESKVGNYKLNDLMRFESYKLTDSIYNHCIDKFHKENGEGIVYITFPNGSGDYQNNLMEYLKEKDIPCINTINTSKYNCNMNDSRRFIESSSQNGIEEYFDRIEDKTLVVFINSRLIEGTTFKDLSMIIRLDESRSYTKNKQLIARLRSNDNNEKIIVCDYCVDRIFDIDIEDDDINNTSTKEYITLFYEYNDVTTISVDKTGKISEVHKENIKEIEDKIKRLSIVGSHKVKDIIFNRINEEVLSKLNIFDKGKSGKSSKSKTSERMDASDDEGVDKKSSKKSKDEEKAEEERKKKIIEQYIVHYIYCMRNLDEYVYENYMGYTDDEIKHFYKNVIIKYIMDVHTSYEDDFIEVLKELNDLIFDDIYNML